MRTRALVAIGVVCVIAAACSADSGGGSPKGSGGSSASGSGGTIGVGGSAAGGGTLNTDSGSTGGSSQLGDAACATATYDGERQPLDMHIVFDRSGSMDTSTGSGQSLWNATKQAFLQFIASPDTVGIGVGLQLFPPGTGSGANCFGAPPPNCPTGCIPFGTFCVPAGDEGCNANDYLPPVVVIQQLPGVAQQLTNALNATSPGGGTPTRPAMEAAATAVTAYAKQNVDRKAIIVLATDGNPNDCNSDIGSVATIAANALAAVPPVSTFVIGINNSGVNVQGLHQIAQAGGSSQALIVDPANAGNEFLNAIKQIQGQALGCTFAMPTPQSGETINPNQVNVWFTPDGGGGEQIIYKVNGAADCDPNLGGWYYDNNVNPTEIILCPKSCEAIGGSKGKIRIELGCTTQTIPT